MNKLLLGCVLGILLVTGMMVVAEEKQAPPSRQIGSDAFFGHDPKVIKQKIMEPPPKPQKIESKPKERRLSRPEEMRAPEPSHAPSIMVPDQTPPSLESGQPQEPPKPSEDFLRGY